MKWFDDLATSKKILLAVALLVTALVGVGWLGNHSADTINQRLNKLYERDFTGAVDAMKAESLALELRVVARGALLTSDAAEQERALRKLDELDQALAAKLDSVEKLLVSEELRARLAEIKRDRATWVGHLRDATRAALGKDQPGALAALGKAIPIGDRIRDTLAKIIVSKDQLAKAAAEETDVVYARNRNVLVGAIAIASLLGVLIGVVTGRAVATPLGRAVHALERVAEGDYTQHVEATSKDEIGQLGAALNKAVAAVGDALREVRSVAEGVASASQQLTGAASQISSGAQEQASSLEETAASLEEVSATVRQNADGAQHAVQLATASREVAEKGGEVVGAAVSAMNEITQASRRIADIITTIDEIAFQTNILALNAAVEAARAGEQGRGFAVVAAEVRDLAQRSAAAAKEIKGLINDAGEKVEVGSRHVLGSGDTLRDIVTSVKRVTDMIAEIAAASREQSTGIEQVNKAVTQMDQVTQSNAAQTEELSATAQSLEGQAEQLRGLVARFQLDGARRANLVTAPAPKAPRVEPPKLVHSTNGKVNGKAPARAKPNGHHPAPVAFEEF